MIELNMEASSNEPKKIKYPKSVFFIIINEFCERFSYYGMRTILSLYLTNILLYNESDAKIIYHTFTMLVYFFPLFGAIVSDSFLGKFRTILYVSMIYACGNIVLALAATDPVNLPRRPFTIIGLLLIAVGTGGIKPCVSAFGGDQFVLPQQELQLSAFFSMFYFSINAGSFISTFLTPVLREDVHCFGNYSCYPLAFAVPGILMIISIIIFAAGKSMYKIRQPEGNVVVKVACCIGYAVKAKITKRSSDGGLVSSHWLDSSEEKYGKNLVEDVKATLKVLVLFTPLPVFWALYDQQGTGWTFQAVRMNGDLGFYTILPDQMQVVNPLLILAFIPLFTYYLYPALAKCRLLRQPLHKMVCGGFLTAVAFAVSACVSIALESTYPVLPSAGNTQIRLYNTLACDAVVWHSLRPGGGSASQQQRLPAMGFARITIDTLRSGSGAFAISDITGCDSVYSGGKQFQFSVEEAKAYGIVVEQQRLTSFEDHIDKAKNGLPLVRTIVNDEQVETEIEYINSASNSVELKVPLRNNSLFPINPGTYKLLKGNHSDVKFALGGVYTVLVNFVDNNPDNVNVITVTEPNSVHILWLLPQYIIITAGEIMFSITGLEFSYSQAPQSMKSVLTAAFLLTTAVGNLIIVIIESAKIFEKQSSDFFLYTGLMVLDMIIFGVMAIRYKYASPQQRPVAVANGHTNTKSSTTVENPTFAVKAVDD